MPKGAAGLGGDFPPGGVEPLEKLGEAGMAEANVIGTGMGVTEFGIPAGLDRVSEMRSQAGE